MYARGRTYEASPERLDEIARQLEAELLPRYREQPGYKGFTLIVDRDSGRAVATSWWENMATLEEADELGAEIQGRAAEAGGASGSSSQETYEVLIDDIP